MTPRSLTPWIVASLLAVAAPTLSSLGSNLKAPREPEPEPSRMTLTILDCNDGDTCQARNTDGLKLKLRLLGIDAPETPKRKRGKTPERPGQPYAEEARKALNDWLKGRAVETEIAGTDAFGRYLALVYESGGSGKKPLLINERLVREGYAWAYRGKGVAGPLRELIEKAEAEARSARRGLWGLMESPVDPDIYRRKERRIRSRARKGVRISSDT